jgi:hypothetical protein
VDELKAAEWKLSPRTGAGGQCEFRYQPERWGKACRFLALRRRQKPASKAADRLNSDLSAPLLLGIA